MSTPPVLRLLRQQVAPFFVAEGAILGVYQITDEGEFHRVIKTKHVSDAAQAILALRDSRSWLLYMKEHDGRTTIIAVSEAMKAALDGAVH